MLNTPGIGSVACTSQDVKGVYSAIGNAVQQIHTTRFAPPDAIVMHPRRWGSLLSLLDLQNRPLFMPSDNGLTNAAGVLTNVASEDVVGRVAGLPVCVDANLPTNLGGGTEDPILVLHSSDLIPWESGILARALPEPKASTLTVRLQVYSYQAFSAARYPGVGGSDHRTHRPPGSPDLPELSFPCRAAGDEAEAEARGHLTPFRASASAAIRDQPWVGLAQGRGEAKPGSATSSPGFASLHRPMAGQSDGMA